MRRAPIVGVVAASVTTGALVWLATSLGPAPPPAWKVIGSVSAHRALVVDVEARNPEDAAAIAREIGEPVRSRYTEILVYFHAPGRRDPLRRVQWTAAHGYVETVYENGDK
jgi:hypothetical protein